MSTRTLVPITRPTLPKLGAIQPQLKEILASGQLTNGKYVREFEHRYAEKYGIKHTVAMSSCTDGLTWVMKYFPEGEIILPSFTFCATGNAAHLAGHKLVFADCDPRTCNLDPDEVATRVSSRTQAIVATYVYGNPPDLTRLSALARKHRVKLILDAAHATGAVYRGKYAGSLAWAEVFSLTPTKVLCCGEGGIVATSDGKLAEFLKLAREYGNPGDYNTRFVGTNARMEEFNAILGLEGLKQIDRFIAARNRLARRYTSALKQCPGISIPLIEPDCLCTYKDYTIIVDPDVVPFDRDRLAEYLISCGIEVRRYFFPPLHRQKAFVDLGYGNARHLKNTDYLSRNCLSLPMFSHMTVKDIDLVANTIHEFSSGMKSTSGSPPALLRRRR